MAIPVILAQLNLNFYHPSELLMLGSKIVIIIYITYLYLVHRSLLRCTFGKISLKLLITINNPFISIPCTTPQNLENPRLARKVNFEPDKILSRGKSPRKCIYSVAAQYTAKHRAMFGWPPVSDVAEVTKARRETR